MDAFLPFKKQRQVGNLLSRVDELNKRMNGNLPSGIVDSLDELSTRTGELIVDRLILPATDSEVTDVEDPEYTGGFADGDGIDFLGAGDLFGFGGVSAGILQWGASNTTGKLLFGAGAGYVDAGGLSLNLPTTYTVAAAIKWYNALNTIEPQVKLYAFDNGTTAASANWIIDTGPSAVNLERDTTLNISAISGEDNFAKVFITAMSFGPNQPILSLLHPATVPGGQSLITLNDGPGDVDIVANWASGVSIFSEGSSGFVGFGTNTPGMEPTAGRRYLTIKGKTGRPVLQFTSPEADADNVVLGQQEWLDSNSTNTFARVAYTLVALSGTTAGKRGSYMAFATKPDNDAVAGTERLRIDRNGDIGIGNASPQAKLHITQGTLGSEVLRLESTATSDDPKESTFQNRITTTDGTQTTIATIAIPATTTVMIEARITGRRTGGVAGTAEDGAGYVITGTYKNVAGTATQIGLTTTVSHESQAGFDGTITASGGNALIRVTGATNNSITWHVTYRVYPVGS